jgi:hypothetical protein
MLLRDKTKYRTGMFIEGGACPAVTKVGGHVVYGQQQPLRKPPPKIKTKTNLAEIKARLEAAQKKLDEIWAAARRR